jgi:hypothetical protein
MPEETHPSNEELLLCADGELSPGQAAKIQKHLNACWQCRTRMGEIQSSIADFTQAYRSSARSVPPMEGPRALLKARLAEADPASITWSWRVGQAVKASRWTPALAAMAVVTISLGLIAVLGFQTWRQSRANSGEEARLIPRQSLTPGAIRIVTRDEVCSADSEQSTRFVPASLKQKVFEEYGVSQTNVDAYEVDYLITPELGGADDIRNLWPQSYVSTEWNAHVKDALEQRLHEMVCTGQVDLATAQHDLATDWIAAYKKYFLTDKPF